jgi:hypothetical protein
MFWALSIHIIQIWGTVIGTKIFQRYPQPFESNIVRGFYVFFIGCSATLCCVLGVMGWWGIYYWMHMKEDPTDIGFYYAVLTTVFFVNLQGLVLYIMAGGLLFGFGVLGYMICYYLGLCRRRPGLMADGDANRQAGEGIAALIERFMGVNKDTLNKKDLENLEKHMKKIDDFSLGELLRVENEDCPICLEKYKVDETVLVLPTCGHVSHKECIVPWFKKDARCSNCRASVKSQLKSQPRAGLAEVSSNGATRMGIQMQDIHT